MSLSPWLSTDASSYEIHCIDVEFPDIHLGIALPLRFDLPSSFIVICVNRHNNLGLLHNLSPFSFLRIIFFPTCHLHNKVNTHRSRFSSFSCQVTLCFRKFYCLTDLTAHILEVLFLSFITTKVNLLESYKFRVTD